MYVFAESRLAFACLLGHSERRADVRDHEKISPRSDWLQYEPNEYTVTSIPCCSDCEYEEQKNQSVCAEFQQLLLLLLLLVLLLLLLLLL